MKFSIPVSFTVESVVVVEADNEVAASLQIVAEEVLPDKVDWEYSRGSMRAHNPAAVEQLSPSSRIVSRNRWH